MNRYGLTAITLGAVFAIPPLAQATDEARWYVSPAINYLIADDDRIADNDFGLQLGLGKEVSQHWNIEINALADNLDFESGQGKFKQRGLSLDALYFLDRADRVAPYGLLGLGALRTEVPSTDSTDLIAEVGFGFMSRLGRGDHLTENGLALRTEVRYRYNADDNSITTEDGFGDWILSLGLMIPFGGHTAPTPAPVPAPVAPTPADDDKDGINNTADRCPNTAQGATVNPQGCELDSDSDGVKNSADQCPNTASAATVNRQGCELDDDNDGVKNSADKCPNTAPGIKVGSQGCELDSDHDGIKDSADRCPNTVHGAKTDSNGCKLKEVIALKDVTFANNSDELTGNSAEALNEAAATLRRHPELSVEVAGYTDNRGAVAYNVQLSQKRANAVRAYLLARGVAADKLSAKGYGPKNPIADNASKEGRATNRRVELRILK